MDYVKSGFLFCFGVLLAIFVGGVVLPAIRVVIDIALDGIRIGSRRTILRELANALKRIRELEDELLVMRAKWYEHTHGRPERASSPAHAQERSSEQTARCAHVLPMSDGAIVELSDGRLIAVQERS